MPSLFNLCVGYGLVRFVTLLCLLLQIPPPLGSLCVNLLLDPSNARKVCNSKAHEALMSKFLETKDIFLAKAAKALSLYTYRVQEALGDDDEYAEIEVGRPTL